MTLRDKRSYRVALVADRYLNPAKGKLDAVPILLEADWGAIQLPSDDYPSAVAGPLLEQVAEQVEEFHRRGYDAVVIGRRAGLDEALEAAGVPHLDQIEPATARALQSFLTKRPTPAARVLRRRTTTSRR
jgi:hypothetical protein